MRPTAMYVMRLEQTVMVHLIWIEMTVLTLSLILILFQEHLELEYVTGDGKIV